MRTHTPGVYMHAPSTTQLAAPLRLRSQAIPRIAALLGRRDRLSQEGCRCRTGGASRTVLAVLGRPNPLMALWSNSCREGMKARTRLFKELKEAQRDATAEADFQLLADDTNIYSWTAFLKVRRPGGFRRGG